jgi:hypothetical protein
MVGIGDLLDTTPSDVSFVSYPGEFKALIHKQLELCSIHFHPFCQLTCGRCDKRLPDHVG